MAVRTALGASPLRVVRQLLTESVLLASAGGALGVAVAFLALRGMLAIHPPSVPRIEEVSIDGGVLAYSLLISVVVGILFGMAPAIEAARVDVNDGLRERGSATEPGIWQTSFDAGDYRNGAGLHSADWYRACAQGPLVAAERRAGVCSEERADLPHRCALAVYGAADSRSFTSRWRSEFKPCPECNRQQWRATCR